MQVEKNISKKFNIFSNEKTRTRNFIILLLPFFILLVCFIVLTAVSTKDLLSGSKANVYSNEIEGMNIYLRDNATELQKDLFKQLQQAYRDGNDEEAARLTAECFIADFYTWTNKYGSYDVGGVYYCADRYNVELFGRDTFYKYVSYYIDKYGSDNLLEVTSIEANGGFVEGSKYEVESAGASFDQYAFEVSWEYADHAHFTDKEFCTFQYVIVVKSNTGRFEIVEAYG